MVPIDIMNSTVFYDSTAILLLVRPVDQYDQNLL